MIIPQRFIGGTKHALAAIVLLACYTLSCQPVEDPDPESGSDSPEGSLVSVLEMGQPIEREIAPGEVHFYALDLRADHFIEVVVDQRGIDVVTTLFDPRGEAVARSIDRPIGGHGYEPLLGLVVQQGIYQIEVRSFNENPGKGIYQVNVADLRKATASDRARVDAAKAVERGEELSLVGDYDAAEESYRWALGIWREVDDVFWRAETLERIGFVAKRLGRWREAIEKYRESDLCFREAGDTPGQWLALKGLGTSLYLVGDARGALEVFQRQLGLLSEDRSAWRETTLVNLAQTYQALDQVTAALEQYSEARRLLQSGANPAASARTLHQMGLLYRTMGKTNSALDHFNEAEATWAKLGNSNGRAASIHQRGRLFLVLGNLGTAERDFNDALELRRETGHSSGQVAILTSLGELRQALGEQGEAADLYRKALELLRLGATWSPVAESRLLRNLGALTNPDEAFSLYTQSLKLCRQVGDLTGEAESLLGLAGSERRRGELSGAVTAVEAAIELMESVRPRSFSDDLSHSFFARAQPYFEFYIDLQMDLHRLMPSAGHDAKALAASERARARGLLDLLDESGAEVRAGVDPGLVEHELELQNAVNVAERYRLNLYQDRRRSDEERAGATREVRRLLDELGQLRAKIRRKSPHYAALTQPQTLALDEIRGSVLGKETLLLEYWLGVERSFLFLVSPHSLSSFELPGREELERKVMRTHRLLATSHRPEARRAVQDALCDLSRILVQPIADRLKDNQLVIVAHGALQYLPFGALADPRDLGQCWAARPLLLANQTTYLPSASTLALQRKETEGRPRPKGVVAVIADPVFSQADRRLDGVSAATAPRSRTQGTRPIEVSGAGEYQRLPFSRREANSILAIAPRGSSFQAFDFEATKKLVLDGVLADYRIIHLATHAVLDSNRPGLSGIVFSLVDRSGADQDGFLRAHELYNLRLSADLVVLSGCRTALGKEVKGEGLVGMTRALTYAGAQRVVAGLWSVEDRSTAELMERFYRELFVVGSSPSAALRAAQISLWREQRAPYYWAGLVLQGEYLAMFPASE